MTESKRVLPRRAVLKTAGLGVGAGLLTGVSAPAQAAPDTEIWSAEYWTKKGEPPLYIPQTARCAQAGRIVAARPLPGARLVGNVANFRSRYARPRRIFDDERIRTLGLRRLDHGPRKLRQIGPHRRQFRYRKWRAGPEGRNASCHARNGTVEGTFHG